MAIDEGELKRQLGVARASGWEGLLARAERLEGLPAGLLLAIASRETGMRNVVGDGGHGRGLLQIDDRSHAAWLASHSGFDGLPSVEDAALYAARLLREGVRFGRRQGIPEGDLLGFAVSSYNAGTAGALAGYVEGDSDRRTTGGDYARDVLERLESIRRAAGFGEAAALPAGVRAAQGVLRVGSRGRKVARVKELLGAWFAEHAPGEYEALGVNPGPYFGIRLEAAVRAFQERVGIAVDGLVGPQTLGALRAQIPALPKRVSFPEDAYPPTGARWGLQPWIVPQVEAICLRFGLRVTAGHGGSPPHAERSDHRWGGAVDLAGPAEAMADCNLWADRYAADPWRDGAVFRWVGGPAAGESSPEEGHADHVHLSWYRLGPATSVFETEELRPA